MFYAKSITSPDGITICGSVNEVNALIKKYSLENKILNKSENEYYISLEIDGREIDQECLKKSIKFINQTVDIYEQDVLLKILIKNDFLEYGLYEAFEEFETWLLGAIGSSDYKDENYHYEEFEWEDEKYRKKICTIAIIHKKINKHKFTYLYKVAF